MNENNINNIISGLGIFFLWFVLGGAVTFFSSFFFFPIGGISTPPAIWYLAQSLAMKVMPFILMLGGIPAAIQKMRGRPWRNAAAFSFGICAITWGIIMLALLFLADF